MRITELAELTGVSPRQLRHFEARGLLSPARDGRGWRDYDHLDRERVEEIDRLMAAGIPTDLALRLLELRQGSAGEVGRAQVSEELLADVLAFYRRLDARALCLARNRDALAAWLGHHGVSDVVAE